MSNGPFLVLDPSVELIDLGEGRLQFFRENGALTVTDKDGDVLRLIGWCDGTRDEAEICALMAKRRPGGADLVHYLIQARCLTPARPPASSNLINQIMAAHAELAQAGLAQRAELATRPLRLVLIGAGAFADELFTVLESLGHVVAREDEATGRPDIFIAVSDALDHAAFRALNRRAAAEGVASAYACIDRHLLRLGPVVIPGETACFECHHHRLRSHVQFVEEFEARAAGRRLRDAPRRPGLNRVSARR